MKDVSSQKRLNDLHGACEQIYTYGGNCFDHLWHYRHGYVGLADRPFSPRDFQHDLNDPLPYFDGVVDRFQVEDAFEHIQKSGIPKIFAEIYRVLKPGGLFRFSVPDYRCDILRKRSYYDFDGNIVFDPWGLGHIDKDGVSGGGHVWFPVYEDVKELFDSSPFEKVDFLHFHESNDRWVCRTIDYELGHILRTPDHDPRVKAPYRPMSIVVDAWKR